MATANEFESSRIHPRRTDLWRDLYLPTILFMALGGMTWAVRGCSGFGGVAGCTFAGVTWGAAWWYLAQDPSRVQARRYASGWIVLAVTVGVGLSGARGWMQWSSFFEGKIQTNFAKGEFLPISRSYGFLWLFIAGVPWGGIGACLLAWCGSSRETRVWHWIVRIACGIGGGLLAGFLCRRFPQFFLPMYDVYRAHYTDLKTNPNLGRLINDCNAAVTHMGYYLGFLAFEVVRKEWKNVVLILTVGLISGAGWALCQNWKWAPSVWPDGKFNYWRCWESSGGLAIGLAYGIAYFLVNRPMSDDERAGLTTRRSIQGPSFEWLLVYTGLTSLVGLFYHIQMGARRDEPTGWGPWYLGVALVFGLVYYLWNRRTASSEVSGVDPPPLGGVLGRTMTALVAVLVVGAAIAGLFPGVTQRFLPEGPDSWRYLLVYQAAVMAVGLFWYWLNRASCDAEKVFNTPAAGDPNLEWFGVHAGLLLGLGLSIRNGAKGWFNLYRTDRPESEWGGLLWDYLGPVFLAILVLIVLRVLIRPRPREFYGRLFPHAYGLMWLVLIVQNAIAFAVTGPYGSWPEAAFGIYYLLLFVITAVVVVHDHMVKTWQMSG